MSTLLNLLARNQALLHVRQALGNGARSVLARGVPRAARGALCATLFHSLQRPCLVIVAEDETAEEVAADAAALLGDERVVVFPSRDLLVGAESVDVRSERERLAVLEALTRGEPRLVVAPVIAVAELTVPPQLFRHSRFEIQAGEELDRDVLARQLVDAGYERVDAVEHVGQFSVRGGIVDVYPPSGEHPVRLEFFGDAIESLRVFDLASQRSLASVPSCLISTPHEVVLTRESVQRAIAHVLENLATEAADEESDGEITRALSQLENLCYFAGAERFLPLLYPERPTLLNHLPADAVLILIERAALASHVERIEDELRRAGREADEALGAAGMLDFVALLDRMRERPQVFITVGEEAGDEPCEEASAADSEDEPQLAALCA